MEFLTYSTILLAVGFASAERQIAAIASRTGRKPVREIRGWLTSTPLVLAGLVFLLVVLSGTPPTLAKTAPKVEKLRAAYALDESIDETDGRLMRRKLLKLLSRSDVKLFLSVIKLAEAGEPDLMVGGCRAHSLKNHSALLLPLWCRYPVKGWGYSSASGNYQLLLSNWKEIAPFLGLRDFSETSQALAALELIRRGGGAANAYTEKGLALKQRIQGGFLRLLQGDVNAALCMSTYDWASSSCSTLPAKNKIIYTHLAAGIRKRAANCMQPHRGENTVRVDRASKNVKVPTGSPRRAITADLSRTKDSKPGYSTQRGKE